MIKRSKYKRNLNLIYLIFFYLKDSLLKIDSKMCENISCSDDKYKYFKKLIKCPDDSSIIQLDEVEEKCCSVKYTCECNRCDSKIKMIEWCKLAGIFR